MGIHFTATELEARRQRACAALVREGLDGILMFRQESMYYLTGYDSMGYITFQCMYLRADGKIALLTREPDRRQSRFTSILEPSQIRVFRDSKTANPALELRGLIEELGGRDKRLGIEYEAFGLSTARGRLVTAAFADFAELIDASDVINRLRRIKSPAEIACHRTAAAIADDSFRAALEVARPGIRERDVLGAMLGRIFERGGDYPASRFIVGAGPRAMLVRNFTGHEDLLKQDDHLQLEFGAQFRHYHACLMRTVYLGKPRSAELDLYRISREALEAAFHVCRPGEPVSAMFSAYARICDTAEQREHRLNSCGYSLGATYPPTWMDGALITEGQDIVIEPGMVFFPHMILLDTPREQTGCVGETWLVGERGSERLSTLSYEPVIVR